MQELNSLYEYEGDEVETEGGYGYPQAGRGDDGESQMVRLRYVFSLSRHILQRHSQAY